MSVVTSEFYGRGLDVVVDAPQVVLVHVEPLVRPLQVVHELVLRHLTVALAGDKIQKR